VHSQALRRALLGALTPFLALLLSVSAEATPVLETLTPASAFSSGFSASGTVTAVTSLGNVSGPFSMGGSLTGTPGGTVQVDWGAPGWNDSLAIPPSGVKISGAVSGGASGVSTLDLFGLLSVSVGFQWTPGTLGLTGGDFLAPTTPSDGATPGPGPWVASGPISASLGIDGDLAVSLNGSRLATIAYPIGPPVMSTAMTLERVGGFPGTGSQVGASFAVSGSVPRPPPATISSPRCLVLSSFGVCTLILSSLDVTISKVQLTNPSLDIWATSTTAIVPEPGRGLLLGVGLAAVLLADRVLGRSRRRAPR
jgi:hypothetical protein